MTREEITAALSETVRRNGMEGSAGVHVRLMVTRGDKKTLAGPASHGRRPNVVIAEHKVADPGVKERGIRLFTSTVRRPPPIHWIKGSTATASCTRWWFPHRPSRRVPTRP